VTDRDKLLFEALQCLDAALLDPLMLAAQKRGLSIGDTVALAMRERLALMSQEERAEAVQQFMDEAGIDLEEIY